MLKRKSTSLTCCERNLEVDLNRSSKRPRLGLRRNLLELSDEILIRCLSFLNVQELLRCERVCSQLSRLAQDDELWRQKYQHHFIQPRKRRIRHERPHNIDISEPRQPYARVTTVSHGSNNGGHGWRQKYKTKSNWTRGHARKSEIMVGESIHSPVLARTSDGLLYTVGMEHGLRVWQRGTVLASHDIRGEPTALAVHTTRTCTEIVVGSADGSIQMFQYSGSIVAKSFTSHKSLTGITSLALSSPFVMVLYDCSEIEILQVQESTIDHHSFKILTTLQSEAKLTPAALSLRKTNRGLQAGIAYAFNRFNTGWCLGIQEIKLDLEGRLGSSRAASNVGTPIRDNFQELPQSSITTRSAYTISSQEHPHFTRPPNSLSYGGCYVLAGLPDNTLMVYNIISTEQKLDISMGRRLWGHTSAVSAAEVNSTGKALSVSAKSDEMRYWELEDILSSRVLKKTSTTIQTLTRAIRDRGNGLGLALANLDESRSLTSKWVSFDDEQVIVVGARDQVQILSCYDFS